MTVRELIIKIGYDTDEKSLNKAEDKVTNFQKTARRVALGAVAAIFAIGVAAVKSASDMEDLTAQFEVMLGDVDKAADMMDKLKEFSASTPFQLADLAKGTQNLIGFGVPAEQAIDALRMLGDTAGGNTEKLNSLVLAYGKVQSKGKASMEEINMMAERGIPIIGVLQKQLGVTEQQFFKLVSAGKIGKKEITAAFSVMTSEGGMFFEGMKKASMTFSGMISTMKDNITIVLAEIGSKLLPTLKIVVDQITKLFQGSLGQLLMDLFDALNPIIVQITDLILKLMDVLQPVLSQIIKSLIPIITTVLGGVTNVLDILMPSLVSLFRLIGRVFELLSPFVDSILQPMLFLFEMLATAVEPFLTMMIELLEKLLVDVMADLGPTLQELSILMVDMFRLALPFIKIAMTMLAFVGKMFGKIILLGNKLFFKILVKGLALVVKLLKPLGVLLETVLLPIMDEIMLAWDSMSTFIEQAINKFTIQIVNWVTGIFDIINALIDKLNMIPGVDIEAIQPIDPDALTATLLGETTNNANNTNVNVQPNIYLNGDISNREQLKQGMQNTAKAAFQIELQKILVSSGY